MTVMDSDNEYLKPYRDSVARHGVGFSSTLWANPRSQKQRFIVFETMLPLTGKRVLDAGCSRGDFAAYLLENNIAYAHYTGIDALPQVISAAQQRNLPNTSFHCGDFVSDASILRAGKPQVICISGTLNTMTDEQASTLLDHAWQAADEALIFNFLSDQAGPGAEPQTYPARRLPTMALLQWAFGRTWDVQFRQDYFQHGHDATILMRKP